MLVKTQRPRTLRQVLLLNSTYEPINICSWKRAIVLVIKGKAVQVEFNSQQLGAGYHLPLVIRLLYYVKIPHKDIPLTRKNLMHRDSYTCQYCGNRNHLTVDHVMPRSRGGKDEWENVVVACHQCNVFKGNRTPKEAGMTLGKKLSRPYGFINFELSKHHYKDFRRFREWRKYLFH